MRLSRLALVSAVVLLVAACSAAATPTPSSVAASQPAGSATLQTVEVKLWDSLRMDPATMTLRAAQPIRFVVTNMSSTNHEFYLGDDAAQMAHDG